NEHHEQDEGYDRHEGYDSYLMENGQEEGYDGHEGYEGHEGTLNGQEEGYDGHGGYDGPEGCDGYFMEPCYQKIDEQEIVIEDLRNQVRSLKRMVEEAQREISHLRQELKGDKANEDFTCLATETERRLEFYNELAGTMTTLKKEAEKKISSLEYRINIASSQNEALKKELKNLEKALEEYGAERNANCEEPVEAPNPLNDIAKHEEVSTQAAEECPEQKKGTQKKRSKKECREKVKERERVKSEICPLCKYVVFAFRN
ncbi:hypothetical protein TELCIR_05757, partial [Teladorsagia circumcincta]